MQDPLILNRRSILTLLILVVIAGGLFYYYRRISLAPEVALREYQKVKEEVVGMTLGDVNFYTAREKLDTFTKQYGGNLPPQEKGLVQLLSGRVLSTTDHLAAVRLFKKIIDSDQYPKDIRALAINLLMEDYEINFVDRNAYEKELFTGDNWAATLSNSGGDVTLAIRKLNEQSVLLAPNAIANYRIALWFASELHKSPPLSENTRKQFLEKIQEHLVAGDQFLSLPSPKERKGMAYLLKARALHLAGEDKERVDELFRSSLDSYYQSKDIFSIIFSVFSSFYYAAFLDRNYGTSRTDDIRSVLQLSYGFLEKPRGTGGRGVRLISFLTAARDSQDENYPYPDFNRTDLLKIGEVYPKLGSIINNLNLMKYIQGQNL